MMVSLWSVLFITVWVTLASSQLVLNFKLPSEESYMELYESSLVYYRNTDYCNTQHYIEFALADKRYRDVMLIKCHERCSSPENELNNFFFSSLVSAEKCTKKCMKKLFNEPLQLPFWIIKDFKNYEPYNFLQFAYYKSGNLQAAYEAAKLFLKYNKESEMMQQNVKFYGNKIKETASSLLHEQPDSVDMFKLGTASYNKADYASATDHFNASLNLYMEEVNSCKILCQTGYDEYVDRKAPNLTDTNTFQEQFVKLYHRVMECRYKCLQKYNKDIEVEEDYLPRLLNYLQFSAFQNKNTMYAAQIASAYLQIKPGDQVMTQNLKYFISIIGSEPVRPATIQKVIDESSVDMEVLATIVGKKDMRKRLKDKHNFSLGDMGSVSELNPDQSVLWRNTY